MQINLTNQILFFLWGNTFYLLDRIRKTNFIPFIRKHISDNKIYVGISAGSIIVHKTIEITGWGKEADPNLIGLHDLSGIGIIKTAVFPHYKATLKKEITSFKKNTSYPIKEIRDGEAFIINGNKGKLIRK